MGRFIVGFLIVLVAASLFLIPFPGMIYDFRTDYRDDEFTVDTAVGETTGAVVLIREVYDSDINTISITSTDNTDSMTISSYNSTSKILSLSGMTANASRTLNVNYQIDALENAPAFSTFIDITPFIWYAFIVLLMGAGVVSILL